MNNNIKQQFKEFYTVTEKTLERGVIDIPQDSREFFEETKKYRYSLYPYFQNLMEFDKYRGKKVLEIGVGQGVDHSQFAKNGAIMYGLDLTPRHIQITQKRFDVLGLKSDLLVADAEELSFSSESFDLVYSCGVLFLVPDIEKAVNEIYRVLKPGGKVIALFYNKNSFYYYINIIAYQGIIKGELQYLTFDKLKDWHAGDGFAYPPIKYFNKRMLRKLFNRFSNQEFFVTTLTKGHLPGIGKFFTQGMIDFYSKYFGFYITIKATK